MNATTQKRQVVSVWLDETSDPEWTAWVVSRDLIDETGGTLQTETTKCYRLDQHPDAKTLAVEYGTALAERLHRPLVIERSPAE